MRKKFKDAFTEFPPLEYAKPEADTRERVMEMAKPLTPKSERLRSGYGSLEISVQTVKGLCSKTSKCIRRDNHSGGCWPT